MLTKAHSEAALAAHIYYGWKISSVCRDPDTGGVSEHVLRWDLPGAPRYPTHEEVTKFVHLSNVEAQFSIENRGVVIAPGLPRSKAGILKHDDFIVLIDYNDSALLTQVRAMELSSPPSLKGWAILLSGEIQPDQVAIGMQVWAPHKN
jgi:hypothetical protein